MTQDERRAHYIRPLVRDLFPRRYVILDTETRYETEGPGLDVHRFRIASAEFVRWRDAGSDTDTTLRHFASPDDLWHAVDKFLIKSQPVSLWCHNLGFDLQISRALIVLPRMGYEFAAIRLGEDISWAKAVRLRDGATLTFCDTFSFWPTTLDAIGKMMGIRKAPLPPNDDDDIDAWYKRCDRDVMITRRAVLNMHTWLRENHLGPWRMTGPAQAWAIWRRRFLSHRVLVHDDPAGLEAERIAAYAGRAEAFRHGVVNEAVDEWDYRHAYASICAMANLPSYRMTEFIRVGDAVRDAYEFIERGESPYLLGCSLDSVGLVEATVRVTLDSDADVPVLPHRIPETGDIGSRIVWPIGRFRGYWWLPELLAARQAGQLSECEIHAVSLYRCEPILRAWAEWAISVIDDQSGSPLISGLVKHMARTLIGRFGMRYVDYAAAHLAPTERVMGGKWVDGDSASGSAAHRMMQIGQQVYVATDAHEGEDSAPQVMSYVMALTRLRLLGAIDAAGGAGPVVYCDTDGLFTTAEGSRRLRAYSDVSSGLLRRKATWRHMTILGPKQLLLEDRPRVAGLPSRPVRHNADGSWTVERWERARAALEAGTPDQVRVRTVVMHVPGKDGRRLRGDGGTTLPISIGEAP